LSLAVRDIQSETSDDAYLRRVGERVREARARRGMTRKLLARDSGVSERYIAQLESGQGNISILLLRQIAGAMNLSAEELVYDGADRPVELTLLIETLRRLNPAELGEARRALGRMFEGDAAQARGKRIALIGLRGAGKSTLGAKLARDRGVPFVELDREIERIAGASLSEIFDLYGQAAYRRYERRALEAVLESHDRAVIATGGSIVSEPGTYDLLLTTCYTIWLTAAPEEHMSRVVAQSDLRPMAGNDEAMADLRRILDGRDALYAKADVRIDTAGETIAASFKRLKAAARAAR
jgi:XRE family transcriptional regulator, aerobic/anaerobic benzoate catabolism transcriptional regulator